MSNSQTDFRDPRWNDEQTALSDHAADYHVVCHDCEFEEIVHSGSVAYAARSEHASETDHDHDVEDARIDR